MSLKIVCVGKIARMTVSVLLTLAGMGGGIGKSDCIGKAFRDYSLSLAVHIKLPYTA